MSYAGKESRTYRGSTTAGRVRSESTRRPLERERPISSRRLERASLAVADGEVETDWQHVTIFAAGAFLGAMLGAGAALLLAPQTGKEVRHDLARRGRRWRARTADAWDDLRDELQFAARRGRRKLGRALRRRRENREWQSESGLDD
jgi:YtxH-like protein